MLKYLLLISILIILYLARNKIIEPLGPISIRKENINPQESDNASLEEIDNASPEESDNASIKESDGDNAFITNNFIDYANMDVHINNIIKQYNTLQSNMNKFKFSVKYVDNNLYQNEEPTITLGGEFPNNIELNFAFPPPLPGEIGEKGDKGKKGPKGPDGQMGERGPLGGNNYC